MFSADHTNELRYFDEARDQEVTVTLIDNGPALPQEALRVVLDPFVVSSGTPCEYGINLMACFFIVHHHGGRIESSWRGYGVKEEAPARTQPCISICAIREGDRTGRGASRR